MLPQAVFKERIWFSEHKKGDRRLHGISCLGQWFPGSSPSPGEVCFCSLLAVLAWGTFGFSVTRVITEHDSSDLMGLFSARTLIHLAACTVIEQSGLGGGLAFHPPALERGGVPQKLLDFSSSGSTTCEHCDLGQVTSLFDPQFLPL